MFVVFLFLYVMVGVLWCLDGWVLISECLVGKYLVGFWEFFGGKFDLGEVLLCGLVCELYEEIGIQVIEVELLFVLLWCYDCKELLFDIWLVFVWQGVLQLLEQQLLDWVLLVDLLFEWLVFVDWEILCYLLVC